MTQAEYKRHDAVFDYVSAARCFAYQVEQLNMQKKLTERMNALAPIASEFKLFNAKSYEQSYVSDMMIDSVKHEAKRLVSAARVLLQLGIPYDEDLHNEAKSYLNA